LDYNKALPLMVAIKHIRLLFLEKIINTYI